MGTRAVPLAALRELRSELTRIRERHPHLAGPPGDADDVAAWERTLKETDSMSTPPTVSMGVRVTPETLADLERLTVRLASTRYGEAMAGRLSRARVADLALRRGIAALWAEVGRDAAPAPDAAPPSSAINDTAASDAAPNAEVVDDHGATLVEGCGPDRVTEADVGVWFRRAGSTYRTARHRLARINVGGEAEFACGKRADARNLQRAEGGRNCLHCLAAGKADR